MAMTGTVKFFNGERGYGFIKPDDGGRDVFVHITAVERAGLKDLTEGQRITFEVEPDKKGKGPKAVNLVISSLTRDLELTPRQRTEFSAGESVRLQREAGGSDRRGVHDVAAPRRRRTFGFREETRGNLRRADVIDMSKTSRAHFCA